ncbi:MazG family protein, partial [Frankia sp. CNm7]|uniref:nucleoside triphosphate pyrophosphohydrolase n=1 Tax=Frankia nepalensis TaxID=1836974 RepID=UPI00193118FA
MTGPGPRVTLLETSARVAPGLLTAEAWDLVRRVPVRCADGEHPLLAPLRAAGVEPRPLPTPAGAADGDAATSPAPSPVDPAASLVTQLRAEAVDAGADEIVWLLDPVGGWPGPRASLDGGLRAFAATRGAAEHARILAGTHDVAGSSLLDAVAVMDRLRSPGGCPWDAEQTHASLAPYLLEEAYEAYQAIEDVAPAELREELGDVLMQVVFHARVAQEATDGPVGEGGSRFDVDEVAAGLVNKLVRRHPHVFGDVAVAGADEVLTNWDAIKAAEKGRRSVTEGVPLSQPALALALKLQKRADKIGVPADRVLPEGADAPAGAVAAALAGELAEPGIGDLLFAAVALAAPARVDPEG